MPENNVFLLAVVAVAIILSSLYFYLWITQDCCTTPTMANARLGDDVIFCGNNICQRFETCSNCPEDCGECPQECGDDRCTGDETCVTCQEDCGECIVKRICETDDNCEFNPEAHTSCCIKGTDVCSPIIVFEPLPPGYVCDPAECVCVEDSCEFSQDCAPPVGSPEPGCSVEGKDLLTDTPNSINGEPILEVQDSETFCGDSTFNYLCESDDISDFVVIIASRNYELEDYGLPNFIVVMDAPGLTQEEYWRRSQEYDESGITFESLTSDEVMDMRAYYFVKPRLSNEEIVYYEGGLSLALGDYIVLVGGAANTESEAADELKNIAAGYLDEVCE